MISLIEGRPGQGKTVFLTMKIIEALEKGRNVYANLTLNTDAMPVAWRSRYTRVETMEEVTRLREGLVVLDEIQIYLNSRNWDKLPPQFMLFLQQHRKRSLDILGATQSVKRADVVLRELVQFFYTVEKLISFTVQGHGFGLFLLRQYDPDSMEGDKQARQKQGWPSLVYADPFALRLYNTLEEYVPEDLTGRRIVKEFVMTKKTVDVESLLSSKVLAGPG